MGVISLVGLLAQHPLFFYSFRFSLSIFLSFNLRHLDFAKTPKRPTIASSLFSAGDVISAKKLDPKHRMRQKVHPTR